MGGACGAVDECGGGADPVELPPFEDDIGGPLPIFLGPPDIGGLKECSLPPGPWYGGSEK